MDTKPTAPAREDFSKHGCFPFCFSRPCVATGAIVAATSRAPSPLVSGPNAAAYRRTVNRMPPRTTLAALRRSGYTKLMSPGCGLEAQPGVGGRLQQYWLSNTGCPARSNDPSGRLLGRAHCCQPLFHAFSLRLPYLWFPTDQDFPASRLQRLPPRPSATERLILRDLR